jgi:glycosyltransferase involved in cell wall biosynthesis
MLRIAMISVITTVLNEGDSLRGLLDSLVAQTRPPQEVLIVDGGSRDHTLQVLQSYQGRLPLRVIQADGANISAGRNIAIRAATGSIIAVTDGGVILAADWLARLVAPLEADPATHVCGGFFLPDVYTVFEAAMGATVLPQADEIHADTFLPSSRSVALRREAWAAVGGYPEWLDYCEDLVFDLNLKARYQPFAVALDAIAHFRPRGSLRAFWKQYYLYARGDGKADLWRKRHAIRYATYLLALPVVIALAVGVNAAWWLVLVLGGAAYLRGPVRRLPRVMAILATRRGRAASALEWLQAVAWLPIIRAVGDVAKLCGYPVGVLWRWQHPRPAGD